MNYSPFEMSGIELSFWLGRTPHSSVVHFFPVSASQPFHTSRGPHTEHYWEFVAQGRVVQGYGVAFLYGSKTFKKTGFRQKRNFEKV